MEKLFSKTTGYWVVLLAAKLAKKLNIEIFEFDTSVPFLSHTFLTTTIVLIKFYFAVCGTGMA